MLRTFIAASLFAAASALAQNDMSKVEITTQQVAPSIYMLTGAGGNIGVVVGDDGVVMIDDQYAPLTPKIREAIAKLTDKPIRFVINTHWHGDHTGGNENLGGSGVIIVAQENVRKRMSSEQVNTFFDMKTPASPKGALPVITFADSVTFHLDGQTMNVTHAEHGHTDGDAVIRFTEANVIHTGDLVFNGNFPFIDTSSGGSIDGMIRAVEGILKSCNDGTRIIPGHGALANTADVRAFHDMLVDVRARISRLQRSGKTSEQAIAGKPLQDLAEKWGKGFVKADMFTKMVYNDLKVNGAKPARKK